MEGMSMNYDNEKLRYIKMQKAELKKEMDNCSDEDKFIRLSNAYHVLCDDEKSILKNMDVKL